jgi:hypothetical protein
MRKIQKKKEGKNGENKKKEIFIYVEVPILVCSPSVENGLRLSPSAEPTHMGTSLTTQQNLLKIWEKKHPHTHYYCPPTPPNNNNNNNK